MKHDFLWMMHAPLYTHRYMYTDTFWICYMCICTCIDKFRHTIYLLDYIILYYFLYLILFDIIFFIFYYFLYVLICFDIFIYFLICFHILEPGSEMNPVDMNLGITNDSQKCCKDLATTRLDLRNAANSLQIEGKGVLPGDPYHWGESKTWC